MAEGIISNEVSVNHEKPTITIDMAADSIAAEYRPSQNEDSNFFDANLKTFGVFDGMGGYSGGQEASRICTRIVSEELKKHPINCDRVTAEGLLQQTFITANREVIEINSLKGEKMGSTVVYGFFYKNELGNDEIAIANAGDSRAYLFRNGALEIITRDHGVILQSDQNIFDNATNPSDLTPEQLNLYKKRNGIYSCAGRPNSFIDVYHLDIKPNDILLLTSDGIHDNLTTSEIESIISKNQGHPPRAIAEILAQESFKRSKEGSFRSKPDDITALIIKINEESKTTEISTPKEATPELPEKFELKEGQIVNIQHDNGVIESGWKVSVVLEDGSVIVFKHIKPNDDNIFYKKVPYEELEKLNRRQTPKDIISATDFDQLKFTLRHIKGIQGSQDFFSSKLLLSLIEDIKKGDKSTRHLTREFGLRDTVDRLLSLR